MFASKNGSNMIGCFVDAIQCHGGLYSFHFVVLLALFMEVLDKVEGAIEGGIEGDVAYVLQHICLPIQILSLSSDCVSAILSFVST